MRRILFTLLFALTMTTSALAAGFSIGNAKYETLPDGTVELKDFKKVTNDVVLPEKVTDPKNGTEYTVTSIGKGAFKNAQLKSVVVPASVKSLGDQAFMGCKALTSVTLPDKITMLPNGCFKNCVALEELNMNLEGLTNIAYDAFNNCGIAIATSMYVVDGDKSADIKNIIPQSKIEEFKNIIVLIYPSADINVVASVLKDKENPIIVFSDENEGQLALDVFSLLTDKRITRIVQEDYVNQGQIHHDILGNRLSLEEAIQMFINQRKHASSQSNTDRKVTDDPEPQFYAYFGVSEEDQRFKGKPYKAIQAYQKAYENKKMEEYEAACYDVVRRASGHFSDHKQKEAFIRSHRLTWQYIPEAGKNPEPFRDALRGQIINLSSEDIDNYEIKNFLWDCCHGLFTLMRQQNEWPADAVNTPLHLDVWAEKDYLTDDVKSDKYRDDYELILLGVEKCIMYNTGGVLDPSKFQPAEGIGTEFMMQIACLCVLDRWKEAARYFPTVHKIISKNAYEVGYAYPQVMQYLADQLKTHGYSVFTTPYTPTSKSSKSRANNSSTDGLIEFFGQKLLKGAVSRYQKKQHEKRERKELEKALKKINKNGF